MEQSKKILFLGFSQSGKTKILFRLVLHDDVVTIPTIGFNNEKIEISNQDIVIWDLGGRKELISYWIHYYTGVSGIVFVIDRNNDSDIKNVIEAISNMLDNEDLIDVPIAFFMNKGDLEEKVTFDTIISKVGEDKIFKHPYNVFQTTSSDEDSILEGMNWLISQFNSLDAGQTNED